MLDDSLGTSSPRLHGSATRRRGGPPYHRSDRASGGETSDGAGTSGDEAGGARRQASRPARGSRWAAPPWGYSSREHRRAGGRPELVAQLPLRDRARVVVLLGLAASATIPRWWAQRIGEQVDGSIVTGTLLGLFYGFVFTLLPLLVLAAAFRWRRTWRVLVLALGGRGRAGAAEPAHARNRGRDRERGACGRPHPRRRGAGIPRRDARRRALAAALVGLVASSSRRRGSPRSRSDAAGERVAGVRASALDPADEPALALLRGAVRPRLGRDAALRCAPGCGRRRSRPPRSARPGRPRA